MSKADDMGESSAFSRAGTARSTRGRAIKSALDASDPVQLALHYLGHNPDNPRETLGDVTELAGSLRDHGQKQALSIMTRDAYLEANPGREDELEPEAMYVVIDGNRRLAAAREAGLSSLKVMVDNSATNTTELLESALVANIHREAFEPLDEAKALKQLLEIHGTQDKLAKRLHRSQGWVAQRLALLGLTPELKQQLEEGTERVDLLRRVGRKPPEQQQAALTKLKEQAKAKKAKAQNDRKPAAAPQGQPTAPTVRSPVEQQDTSSSGATSASAQGADGRRQENGSVSLARESHYGVMKPTGGEQDESSAPVAVVMPWKRPTAVLQILREHMADSDFKQLMKEGAELA